MVIIIKRKYFNLENFASLKAKLSETFFWTYVWKVLSTNIKCKMKYKNFLIFRLCIFPNEIQEVL